MREYVGENERRAVLWANSDGGLHGRGTRRDGLEIFHELPESQKNLYGQWGITANGQKTKVLCLNRECGINRSLVKNVSTKFDIFICAETKGEHLKNDDSREKIALGQAWRTAAGKDFRYYMVFENEENLLPGAVSMSQFIDTIKAL